MKLYVLTGKDNEDRYVLGIYETLEGARAQAIHVHEESLGGFDSYEVSKHYVNYAAELPEVIGGWTAEDLVDNMD